MATTDESRQAEGPGRPRPVTRRRSGRYRWTAGQYYRLGDLGFFQDRHVELIEGEIYEMTIDPPHAVAVELLGDVLRRTFGVGYSIRTQQPLDFGRRTQPEPDAAIVAGSPRDYAQAHPKTARLIIEVSDSTLRKDRVLKAHIYARAGIADYWIVNLVDRQLEIRRNPGPDPSRRGRFTYADATIVPATGHASPLAAPQARIAVADLLP
jgi:Uma2 family endonuclease